ncbi:MULTISPECIES: cytidine deaminase [Limnochorda]|uniref:cytidine deaminase n=1 Tax=Limnochorda TaxID=1676651 RepID=UPI001818CD75|nr:cytidine deaminase [Limnochorda pilosa]MBO2486514.1 cytidine deaminase [Bacillota bacterium]MBO2519572.1 cytidine deaminase [Bacillota bacterium]NMA72364.1 cytidine deaminase [Bacillota bacterium]
MAEAWLRDEDEALLAAARLARERAYAPYSRFPVGAAVRAADGRIFQGCNIENASYGLTICAERVAVFQAVAAGVRQLVAVAVVGPGDEPCRPCGACRQVLREFGLEMRVIMAGEDGPVEVTTLDELLPRSFGPDHLGPQPG